MGIALTANEESILKSRWQAGADGHSQTVLLTSPTAGSIDVSERVIGIGKDSSLEMDSDSCVIVLANVDRKFLADDPTSQYYSLTQPGVTATVQQWHGVAANAVQTFAGKVMQYEQDDIAETVTFHVQDVVSKLDSEILPTAPQDPDLAGYDGTMANYVYINKTANEVLTDLLEAKGSIPTGDIILDAYGGSFVFSRIAFQAGTVADACFRVAEIAGLRFYADEQQKFRTKPVDDPSSAVYWTFRAHEDITELQTRLSDEGSYTQVKVVGDGFIGSATDAAFQTLWGRARVKVVREPNARTQAEADRVASDLLKAVARFRHRKVVGVLGHPGIQKGDRITLVAPGSGL